MPVTQLKKGDRKTRRHALVVGINDYLDRKLRLPFCEDDAARLADLLTLRGYQVTAFHGGKTAATKATLANVRVALKALVDGADEDDILLVYFNGHGQLVGGRPHLFMADTPNSDDGLSTRGLSLGELLTTLRGAPRWCAVFLDACHMGLGLDDEVGRSTRETAERGGGFALLSGSTIGDITQDTTDGGIFSRMLHEGLAGAAADPDGSVRFSSVAQHIQRGVAAWKVSAEGKQKLARQTPILRLEVADLLLMPPHAYLDLAPQLLQKIRAAVFSPDGRRLATACEDGTSRLWDPASGTQVMATMTYQGHCGGVAFSHDGILLASVSNDGSCQIWQAAGTNPVEPSPAPENTIVNAVAFALDRRHLASGAFDGIRVYALDAIGRAGAARLLSGHDGAVWAIAFAPDGALVSGGADGTVRTWSVATGKCTKTWKHDGPLWAVAVSPDGRYLAAGGADGEPGATLVNVPRIRDRKTGKVVAELIGHRGGVTSIAYTRAGDRIATTSYDGRARIWSAADGRLLQEFATQVPGHVQPPEAYAAAFSPDATRLFVGYADGTGRFYRLDLQ